NPFNVGCKVPEYFQHFPANRKFGWGEAGYIAARTRKCFDRSGTDRIVNLRKDDGNGAGLLLECRHCCRARSQERVGFQSNEFGRVIFDAARSTPKKSKIDAAVPPPRPPKLEQPLLNRRGLPPHLRITLSA